MHLEWDASSIIALLTLVTTWGAGVIHISRSVRGMIMAHEIQDERRHRQNLARFTWIAASLARMGNQTDIPTFDD